MQHVSSNRITIRNNFILQNDSDYRTVMNCLKAMDIQVKNKTVEEIEREIDKRVLSNMSKTISEYPEDAKISGLGEKYLEHSDNRNLIMLKIHLMSLKSWLEKQ